jgi:hypothetical protein
MERVTGAMRTLYERLEIETEPPATLPRPLDGVVATAITPIEPGTATAFVDGLEIMAGPLDRLLASLGLQRDDLE